MSQPSLRPTVSFPERNVVAATLRDQSAQIGFRGFCHVFSPGLVPHLDETPTIYAVTICESNCRCSPQNPQ
jgi:hypothetical protein